MADEHAAHLDATVSAELQRAQLLDVSAWLVINSMRTERVRIGFAVVQMPFHHPVRLAVQLARHSHNVRGLQSHCTEYEHEICGHMR